jgi:hypothetical protein
MAPTIKDPTFDVYKDGGNVERRGKEIKKDDLKQLQAKDDVDLIFDIESGISDRIVRDFYKERKPGQSITEPPIKKINLDSAAPGRTLDSLTEAEREVVNKLLRMSLGKED